MALAAVVYYNVAVNNSRARRQFETQQPTGADTRNV